MRTIPIVFVASMTVITRMVTAGSVGSGDGRHYTFVRPFSFNSSAESGAFFFW
jgi:hypothetical protein